MIAFVVFQIKIKIIMKNEFSLWAQILDVWGYVLYMEVYAEANFIETCFSSKFQVCINKKSLKKTFLLNNNCIFAALT